MNIKHREINFCQITQKDKEPIYCANALLNELNDILMAHIVDAYCLHIAYDLNIIGLEKIETILVKAGFHLDNSLINKLKRAIIYYSEETQQSNAVKDTELSTCVDAAIERYRKRPHGCRDNRPKHWRDYK
jgi:hypothetical protein